MIEFERLNDHNISVLEDWFEQGNNLNKFTSDYSDITTLFKLINLQDRYIWLVKKDNEYVGLVDFEVIGDTAWISFLVKTSAQNQGIGRKMLIQSFNLPELRTVRKYCAGVEKENSISQKLLESLGFKFINLDKDGVINYELQLTS